jgi:murein DD-endopeptidase MepM/ murein hydrolase activator NlpD
VPGGIAILALGPSSAPRPRAEFDGRRVMVVEDTGYWKAVVGLPLATEPGAGHLQVSAAGAAPHTVAFEVKPKTYPAQHIRLADERMVELSDEDLARHERDRVEIRRAFDTWSEEAAPPLRLSLPANGPLSSRFGLRRFFNGKPRAPHSGLDIAAPQGATVTAPAAGTVVVTGDYFFNGMTVFIDHGQGLISMFNHLSRVAVTSGERVAAGQHIGAVGKTGRATGAHLHWTVSLNGTAVDPELLLAPALAGKGNAARAP